MVCETVMLNYLFVYLCCRGSMWRVLSVPQMVNEGSVDIPFAITLLGGADL